MKAMRISDDIVPIGEFKTHAARLMRQLGETGRPIVITQRGRPAGVLVSPADFDRFTQAARDRAAIEEGLAQSEAGEGSVSNGDLNDLLDAKYGRLKAE